MIALKCTQTLQTVPLWLDFVLNHSLVGVNMSMFHQTMHHWRPLQRLYWLYLLTTTAIHSVVTLNIDTRFPVVFEYPHHETAPAGYFGHSVLILNNTFDQQTNSFMVGAPYENGHSKSHLTSTGSIYRCLWNKNDKHTSCKRTDFIPIEQATNNMQLGFNMIARPNNEDQYMSCAFLHVFMYFPPDGLQINPTGSCYLLPDSSSDEAMVISPLRDQRYQFGPHNTYNQSHGMAGFSSVFSEDGKRLFLGAPGVNNWNGALVEIDLDRLLRSTGRIHESIFTLNHTTRDIYMGYSLGIGRFFANRHQYAAIGAPRMHLVGAVCLFDLDHKMFDFEHKLNGSQGGEYFGSALLVADLNNDGLDDILVAAPQYSSYRKGFADEGRVLVYISDGKQLHLRFILNGLAKSRARFGTALAKLGDINHDNFTDVAIGAPYENEGRGAIYIYRGNTHGLAENYTQRISSSEHLSSLFLFGFGYSLSSEVDVDQNRFNDLLVGSYLSNQAVLLRTRPTLSLKVLFMLTEEAIHLDSPCANKQYQSLLSYRPACVHVKFCFEAQHLEANYILNTTLWLDSLSANKRCFVMLPGGQQSNNFVKSSIVLQKKQTCSQEFTVLMKEKTDMDNFLDPVVLTLAYNIDDSNLNENNIFQVPVVEQAKTNITKEVYIKMCSHTQARLCESNIQLRTVVTLDNEQMDTSAIDDTIEIVEGLHRKVTLQMYIDNIGEPAFNGELNITIDNELSLVQLDKRCQMFQNQTKEANLLQHTLQCQLSNPLYKNDRLVIVFNPFDSYEKVHFAIRVGIANRLHQKSVTENNLVLQLVKRSSIDLVVAQSPTLVRYKLDDTNLVPFTSVVKIERTNHSSIDMIELSFVYPSIHKNVSIMSTFSVLNLNTRINKKCEPPNINLVNNNNSTQLNSIGVQIGSSASKVINLTCSHREVLCEVVKCYVGPISSQTLSAYFNVSSQLKISTIRNLYNEAYFENITYRLHVIATIMDKHVDLHAQTIEKKVDFLFKLVDPIPDKPLYIWALIIGIIIGLIILLLVVYLLHKCGFFQKSKSLEEMENMDNKDGGDS